MNLRDDEYQPEECLGMIIATLCIVAGFVLFAVNLETIMIWIGVY